MLASIFVGILFGGIAFATIPFETKKGKDFLDRLYDAFKDGRI